MPKSTAKLPTDQLAQFQAWLTERGYQIDLNQNGWRVIMFRKRALPWTQGYAGKTHSGASERSFLRSAGPESKTVQEFLNG